MQGCAAPDSATGGRSELGRSLGMAVVMVMGMVMVMVNGQWSWSCHGHGHGRGHHGHGHGRGRGRGHGHGQWSIVMVMAVYCQSKTFRRAPLRQSHPPPPTHTLPIHPTSTTNTKGGGHKLGPQARYVLCGHAHAFASVQGGSHVTRSAGNTIDHLHRPLTTTRHL